MLNFETYYKSKFCQDIIEFFSSIPDESRFHEDNQHKQIYSIQYERLTNEFDHLKFLTKPDKEYFGVALFFTVLTDMVCYSHFKQNYYEFKELTRYPKFIGNCPGGCLYHFHPSDIFLAMNYKRKNINEVYLQTNLVFYDKFLEAIPTMEEETVDFFSKHLKAIDGKAFWERCKSEFPYRIKNGLES